MRRLFPGPVTDRTLTPLGASSLAIVLLVLALLAAGFAAAHEGHDDGQPTVASGVQGLPRLVASSEAYELVAILHDERLTIYLDRFENNGPVTDANITVTVNDEAVAAQPSGDGVYSISSKRFAGRGLIELVFDIKAKEGDDLLIGKFTLAGSVQDAGSPDPAVPWHAGSFGFSYPHGGCRACPRPRFTPALVSRIPDLVLRGTGADSRDNGSFGFGP